MLIFNFSNILEFLNENLIKIAIFTSLGYCEKSAEILPDPYSDQQPEKLSLVGLNALEKYD